MYTKNHDGSYSSLLSALPKISHLSASMSTASSYNRKARKPLKLLKLRHRLTESQTHQCCKQTLAATSSMYSSRSRAFLKSYSLARLLSSQMYSWRGRELKRKCTEAVQSQCLNHFLLTLSKCDLIFSAYL